MSQYCSICNEIIGNYDSILLVDGSEIHKECYEFLLHPKFPEADKLSELYLQLNSIRDAIQDGSGIIQSLSRLFNGMKQKEFEILEKQKINIQKECTLLENILNDKHSIIKDKLEKIYDIWYERPPDWSSRQDTVKSYYNYRCCSCQNRYNLHVHHILPINHGGDHHTDNLISLCRDCHEEEHGGTKFQGEYKEQSKQSLFMRRLIKIKEAMNANVDIAFNYRKYEGEKSSRLITPRGLRMVGKSLCVFGYCHLRKEERVFAIKRMSELQIKNQN